MNGAALMQKRGYKVAFMIIGSILAALLALFVANEVMRRKLMQAQQEIISGTQQELKEYIELGFTEKEEIMGVMQARINRAQQHIARLKNQKIVLMPDYTLKTAQRERVEKLLKVNRDTVNSYKEEIEDYIKLGVAENSKPMKFAKDKLVKLVVDIAELESKLHGVKSSSTSDVALTEKMKKIVALNNESIGLYKEEIKDYLKLGLSTTDAKVCFARKCITRKVTENDQLEHRLVD